MRNLRIAGLAALLVSTPALLAQSGALGSLTLQPGSRLWVAGTSTVRSFECRAGRVEASVESAGPGAVQAVLDGSKGVGRVTLTVPAQALDCANGTMNEHMRKALRAKEHPTIAFRLQGYDLAKAADGVAVTMAGELELGGVTKPVTIEARATEAPGDQLRVSGTHVVKMTDHGLKPPSLMLGTMKVDEKVTVGFDLLLKD